MYQGHHISVIVPALNEAESIGIVLRELNELTADASQLVDHIIVCDNGSTDETAAIAAQCDATVVHEPEKGYGAACLAALNLTDERRDIVVFVDADHSVVATEMIELVKAIVEGADLAIGSRTLGNVESGALTAPQRWGNRLASTLIRIFWHAPVTDLGPFRAIRNSALKAIDMQDRRFGWTVEMQVKALQLSLKVVEVPVSTRKRIGKSKIAGTVSGVIGASQGILGMIFKLLWNERRLKLKNKS